MIGKSARWTNITDLQVVWKVFHGIQGGINNMCQPFWMQFLPFFGFG